MFAPPHVVCSLLTSAPPMLTMLLTSLTTIGLFLGGSCIGVKNSENNRINN